jgi:hypothetical protein
VYLVMIIAENGSRSRSIDLSLSQSGNNEAKGNSTRPCSCPMIPIIFDPSTQVVRSTNMTTCGTFHCSQFCPELLSHDLFASVLRGVGQCLARQHRATLSENLLCLQPLPMILSCKVVVRPKDQVKLGKREWDHRWMT